MTTLPDLGVTACTGKFRLAWNALQVNRPDTVDDRYKPRISAIHQLQHPCRVWECQFGVEAKGRCGKQLASRNTLGQIEPLVAKWHRTAQFGSIDVGGWQHRVAESFWKNSQPSQDLATGHEWKLVDHGDPGIAEHAVFEKSGEG